MNDREDIKLVAVHEIDESLVPRVRRDVAAVELDGEAVLLDGTGTVHTLNPTATLVWQCLDGTSSLREIIDDLAWVFDEAGRASIADDVVALAQDLGRKGLLEGVVAHAPVEPALSPAIDDGADPQPRG